MLLGPVIDTFIDVRALPPRPRQAFQEERKVRKIRTLAPRVDSSSPNLLRCSLDRSVYLYLLRRVLPDLSHVLFLETMGVIHRGGHAVQI